MVRHGAFAYTWDLVGDPAAAARIADLGVDTVTLHAAYHSVWATTAWHPAHRVGHAEHAATYFRIRPERWRSARLRPVAPTWAVDDEDRFGTATSALAAVGLRSEACRRMRGVADGNRQRAGDGSRRRGRYHAFDTAPAVFVLKCWDDEEAAIGRMKAAAACTDVPLIANVNALGERPEELPGLAARLVAAGVSEVRYYHAGLASPARLEAIRAAVEEMG